MAGDSMIYDGGVASCWTEERERPVGVGFQCVYLPMTGNQPTFRRDDNNDQYKTVLNDNQTKAHSVVLAIIQW